MNIHFDSSAAEGASAPSAFAALGEASPDTAAPDPDHMARHDGWTPERREIFLDTLSETGQVSVALQASGMGKASLYALRHRDTQFAFRWKMALESSVDVLRALAFESAMKIDTINKYDRNGELIESRQKINDRMLIHLLNRYDPVRRQRDAEDGMHCTYDFDLPSGYTTREIIQEKPDDPTEFDLPGLDDWLGSKDWDAPSPIEEMLAHYKKTVGPAPRARKAAPPSAPCRQEHAGAEDNSARSGSDVDQDWAAADAEALYFGEARPPRDDAHTDTDVHTGKDERAGHDADPEPLPIEPWPIDEDFAIFQRWLDAAMVDARDRAGQGADCEGAGDGEGGPSINTVADTQLDGAPWPAIATHRIRPALATDVTATSDRAPPYTEPETKALFLLWHLSRRGVSVDDPHYPHALLAALNAGDAISPEVLIGGFAELARGLAEEDRRTEVSAPAYAGPSIHSFP